MTPQQRRRGALLAGAAALAAVAYPRAIAVALQHNLARLRAGDPGPLLRFYADDVRFSFPGDSSWSGELTSKAELRAWLERFVRIGLQLHADEIAISGGPWRTTFCIRCSDQLRDDDDTIVYENRAVIWGTMRWGRVRAYEVYEDTQRSAALDAWVAEHRPGI
ncbi:nuclear transport factor 2 family protein [Conexibacter woesei]|uniref:SnoaL-like domain-containing protein n=1 Tax=Conexibacter woesei (strain DSM 14684 / CCUG 47730 / CIP 108061 / JCM 11494 / NBRC 100937 / ID131577) TaxID=469383 RepID=D3F1P6_CONWI|nr:nuclear transport factor 2 family protein [Conexibacter woesei]ADB54077.1 hypothetical protein Cwoe_5673 [Conexibacter woesei DSM 14684]